MDLELTLLMPCLNEARTVVRCVQKARAFLARNEIFGEVLVADNGSTDGSIALAEEYGARVIPVAERGYGAALFAGIQAARGKFIIMGDSDDSYDFSALDGFVDRLRAGDDLVMGNRFRGGIANGAMPPHHRYFGNPFLTAVGRRLFNCTACGDFYCGLRGFRKDAILRLELQSRGMEFALEMVVKASMHGLRISEVPVRLYPDGRGRPPHLRSYRDGWRSLRFYLLMSPRWFFALPGGILSAAGLAGVIVLLPGPLRVGSISFDYHTLLYSAVALVLGYQALILAVIAKLIAVGAGLHPPITRLRAFEQRDQFEKLLAFGGVLALAGLVLGGFATWGWSQAHFGELNPTTTLRYVILSALCLLIGGQTALAGSFLGLVNMMADRRARLGRSAQRAEQPAATTAPLT